MKLEPFISPEGTLTRFIGLGSLPGKHKPEGSKTTYIQAIEVEPLTSILPNDLLVTKEEESEYKQCPFGKDDHTQSRL